MWRIVVTFTLLRWWHRVQHTHTKCSAMMFVMDTETQHQKSGKFHNISGMFCCDWTFVSSFVVSSSPSPCLPPLNNPPSFTIFSKHNKHVVFCMECDCSLCKRTLTLNFSWTNVNSPNSLITCEQWKSKPTLTLHSDVTCTVDLALESSCSSIHANTSSPTRPNSLPYTCAELIETPIR